MATDFYCKISVAFLFKRLNKGASLVVNNVILWYNTKDLQEKQRKVSYENR